MAPLRLSKGNSLTSAELQDLGKSFDTLLHADFTKNYNFVIEAIERLGEKIAPLPDHVDLKVLKNLATTKLTT